MNNEIENTLAELRIKKPLVLNLTNYVTMDFMANVLLALGAAPIMSVCDEEIEELVKISSSININIGTLDNAFINRCRNAIVLAKRYEKPIVLDPVGSGATSIRTATAREFMKHADIIRGNASEIISLVDKSETLGVESVNTTNQAKSSALEIARKYNCTVVVSGEVDYITDGNREAEVNYGSPVMPLITGMGCALTAVIAAFRGISDDSFEMARIATTYYGVCGNSTEVKAKHPGQFRTTFIDNLYAANFN